MVLIKTVMALILLPFNLRKYEPNEHSYGNGWNGAYLTLKKNGSATNTFALAGVHLLEPVILCLRMIILSFFYLGSYDLDIL